MDKIVNLKEDANLQEDASSLLATEMSEVKGGSFTPGCGTEALHPADQALAQMGCESCNKNHSCQTHT